MNLAALEIDIGLSLSVLSDWRISLPPRLSLAK
jgi:hypothetical protein